MKNYSNALFAANSSLAFFETIEMLYQKVQCLRLLNRYEESIELLDHLIKRSENDSALDCQELKRTRALIAEQLSKDNDHQMSPQKRLKVKSEETNDDNEDTTEGQFWIHPSCQLTGHPKRGRHFVAGQFIPKESAILIEHPISCVIASTEQISFCTNCRKAVNNNFWPCRGCDELVFCDDKCYRQAFNKFHQYECGFLGYVNWSLGTAYVHTFRLIARYGVHRVIQWESNKDGYDFKHYISSEKQPDSDSLYRAFASLVDNSSHCDNRSFLHQGFKGIETAFLLEYVNQTNFDLQTMLTLSDICYRTTRRTNMNIFGHSVFIPERKKISGCIAIVGSLFNHSCDPNIFWTLKNGKLVVTALKDIESGEELNITYGPTVRNTEFFERQVDLRSRYHFTCSCKACLSDCRSILTLSCRHCSGPVVFDLPLPSILKDKRIYCLECGEKFRKVKKFITRVKGSKTLFEKSMSDLQNDFNVEVALTLADQSLKKLLDLVYARSEPLLKYVLQMISAQCNHNKLEEAIEYGLAIERAIELELKDRKCEFDTPVIVYNYLLFITECYYKYLRATQVSDQRHWNRCFQIYSKLFQLLEQQKLHETNKEEDQKEKEKVELVSKVITVKKEELKQLQKQFESSK